MAKKKRFLTVEERVKLIKASIENPDNVEGMLWRFNHWICQKNRCNVFNRGLRAVSDFEHEMSFHKLIVLLCDDGLKQYF